MVLSIAGLQAVGRQQHAQPPAQSQPHEAESIILNVAGKLLMFQRDRTGPQPKLSDSKERPVRSLSMLCLFLQFCSKNSFTEYYYLNDENFFLNSNS